MLNFPAADFNGIPLAVGATVAYAFPTPPVGAVAEAFAARGGVGVGLVVILLDILAGPAPSSVKGCANFLSNALLCLDVVLPVRKTCCTTREAILVPSAARTSSTDDVFEVEDFVGGVKRC